MSNSKLKTQNSKPDRKVPPPIKDAIDFSLTLKPYTKAELSNGVPVYMIDAGAQDVLQIELVFYAGNYFERNTGIAAAANYLLKNGTQSRSALELNEAFEYYGAHCSRACYNETAVVSLHTLSRHTDKLLPVLNDMLKASIFPEEELAIYKQNSKQRLAVNLQKCEFVAGRMIDKILFGTEHPYGSCTEAADLDNLTRAQLQEFFERYYLQGNLVIFVAGRLPANITDLLEENFGKLTVSKPTGNIPDIKASPALEKKFRIENDPDAVQGAIRIAQNFPDRHHPDFTKAVVLNTVFGGYFGSRLMSNIREEKGYTYGIYSYLQNHLSQSAWVISTEAGKDVCEPAIEEIYKEMKLLREKKVRKSEMAVVRNYMLGTILGDLDGPFQIIAKWKNIILNNLDENYFYESVKVVKEISADELKSLAEKYLQPEKFYELVVY